MKRSGSNRTMLLAMIVAAAAAVAAYLVMGSTNKEATPAASLPAPTQVPTTGVLVVKQDLAASTVLTEEMVEVKQVPLEAKNERALTKPEDAVGKTTSIPLMRGEQILNSRLEAQPLPSENFLPDLPPGKRAISLSSDEVRAVGGLVQPGDHVDVLAYYKVRVKVVNGEVVGVSAPEDEDSEDEGSEDEDSDSDNGSQDDQGSGTADEEEWEEEFSTFIVQNAEVLAVSQALTPDQLGVQDAAVPTAVPTPGSEDGTDGEETEDSKGPQARPSQKSVTLAVTPEEAQRILHATQASYDKKPTRDAGLRLIVRAPGDTSTVELLPTQLGTIPIGPFLGNINYDMLPHDLIITDAEFTKRLLNSGEMLEFRITVKNVSDHDIRSGKDAPPEFTYTEGMAYDALGFFPEPGTYRIGLNVAGAFPNQFPYRWGLGRDLKPGESMDLVGSVQLTEATANTRFWLGVIQEPSMVTQDGVAVSDVTVMASSALAVKDATAQLRKDPNTAGEVVRDVSQGAELQVKDVRNGWYQVEIDGQEGWIPAGSIEAEAASEDGKPTTPEGDPELVAKRIRERFDPWNREND
ncbi:MAG: Flp pilus assembly protein CpaB [Chloroflexota bacterium]|nr:Flp pilus assembly protein CpaB [Chloroflexota bacterium]